MATFEDIEESFGKPSKKLKENTEVVDEDGEWIVINKKKPQLTISIADYSKINKYYSHRSLQSYLRYLLTQTCPNPMWLTIKRQSLIDHIVYIDLEIENCLCEEMLANKQL